MLFKCEMPIRQSDKFSGEVGARKKVGGWHFKSEEQVSSLREGDTTLGLPASGTSQGDRRSSR